jgi:ABC-type uncharacterized transport system substrate-binding protein
MARLYHTFGDIEGKRYVLRVECIKCERENVRFGSGRVKAAYEPSLGGKWIETLKEIASDLTQAAVLYEPVTSPYMASIARSVAEAGPTFGVEVRDILARNVGELESAIATLGQKRNAGLIVPPAAFTTVNSALIVALAAKYRLPAIYAFSTIVVASGLISYGPSAVDQYRRAAGYVDRILKGEKPADLPVQNPIKYELAINLRTAKALHLEGVNLAAVNWRFESARPQCRLTPIGESHVFARIGNEDLDSCTEDATH